MAVIIDGTGTGKQAKVDENNLLRTRGISVPQVTGYTEDGDGFILASGFIPISNTTSFSGVYYLKNTSTNKDYHIDLFRSCNDQSTYWKLLKNPTTGTVIDTANTATPVNSKFNSSKEITGTFYYGGNELTFTDGTEAGTWIQGGPGHSLHEWKGGIDIGPGQSMGISAQPTAAANVCIMLLIFQATSGEL